MEPSLPDRDSAPVPARVMNHAHAAPFHILPAMDACAPCMGLYAYRGPPWSASSRVSVYVHLYACTIIRLRNYDRNRGEGKPSVIDPKSDHHRVFKLQQSKSFAFSCPITPVERRSLLSSMLSKFVNSSSIFSVGVSSLAYRELRIIPFICFYD